MKRHSGTPGRFKLLAPAALLMAFAGWLLLVSPEVLGRKPFIQPTLEEIAQVWVGLSEGESYLLRLSLQPDGTGIGGLVFAGQAATVFHIAKWTYDGKRVEISLSPQEAVTAGFPTLRGELVGPKMELTMSGPDWKRRLHLRQESELERRWLSLKQAMSASSP